MSTSWLEWYHTLKELAIWFKNWVLVWIEEKNKPWKTIFKQYLKDELIRKN